MGELACFAHPRQKGAPDQSCPSCVRPLSFPLDAPPAQIAGETVEKALDRGFYSAVYRTRNPRTGRVFAVKVTPRQAYEPPDPADQDHGGYGDRKSFRAESDLHSELSDLSQVAGLLDWGEETLDFGGIRIDCYWTRMEYVEGRSLAQVAEDGPRSPREALQIALDLLSLVEQMRLRDVWHNDLHGGNAFVVELPRDRQRREAVDPSIAVKVFDLGSAGRGDASKPGQPGHGGRLGDYEYIAQHILRMLAAYERTNPKISPVDLRISSQLRRTAELYCQRDTQRLPEPRDMIATLRAAWTYAERPSREPLALDSLSLHVNAQTLPARFAAGLLHDPDGHWAARVSGPGPQLLAGMRGCGKTMLLRSLEWTARAYPQDDEQRDDLLDRLRAESYLGLFVSCASLLRTPRTDTVDAPLHRLFLCFARELVRAVALCEMDSIGEVRFHELEPFSDFLAASVPWYEPPANPASLIELEAAVGAALQAELIAEHADAPFNAIDAFDRMAEAARRLVDLWANKHLLFLLDDVSRRFLREQDVERLLTQFCLKSEHFGFKISTEARTQLLFTPGGQAAQLGRDYEIFDLGREVLDSLGGDPGVQFVENILLRRHKILSGGAPGGTPAELLGRQTLKQLARAIHSTPGKEPVYWGMQALAAVCVGNIGDILSLYDAMLSKAQGGAVSKAIQHDVMNALSERRLLALAGQNPWLYAHAVAFAAASNRELRNSDADRLRQYTQVFVRIPPEHNAYFDRLLELVDNGVLVFAGRTPRHKSGQDAPQLQFKLAFNKVLGLTYRIPLSMRDRFEPAGQDVPGWLDHPTQTRLQPRRDTEEEADGADDDTPGDVRPGSVVASTADADDDGGGRQDPRDPGARSSVRQPLAARQLAFPVDTADELPLPRVHLDARCDELPLVHDSVRWADAVVVGAMGFEDRAVGSWQSLVAAGARPGLARLLQYPDNPGRGEEIVEVLEAEGIPHEAAQADPIAAGLSDDDAFEHILATDGPLVVDVTSLTKPLIYATVRHALRRDGELYVVHTCAQDYEPYDDALRPAVDLLARKDFADGFAALDKATSGEGARFEPVAVGPQTRDASQPSLLAAFMSLKLQRLNALLDGMQVERLAAISSQHSSGARSLHSRAMSFAADYLVTRYGGERHDLGTLDADGSYRLLRELHRRHSLAGAFNFEIALTGTKMQAVGAGMFASTAPPAAVYYSRPAPQTRDVNRFTHGTGRTRLYRLVLVES